MESLPGILRCWSELAVFYHSIGGGGNWKSRDLYSHRLVAGKVVRFYETDHFNAMCLIVCTFVTSVALCSEGIG